MPTATAPAPNFTGRHTTDSDPHGTLWLDGQPIPSVTTILPQPDLARAAAHVTAAEAIRNLPGLVEHLLEDRHSRRQLVTQLADHHRDLWDLKAQLGTDVHHWALERCWTDPDLADTAPPHVRQHLNHWNAWAADTGAVPIAVEQTVISRRYRYGGTADCWAVIDGDIVLLDVKTGRTIPTTVPLQLAAYQHADLALGPDGGEVEIPQATRFGVVHLTADHCELHEISAGVHEWDAFRAALALHAWTARQ